MHDQPQSPEVEHDDLEISDLRDADQPGRRKSWSGPSQAGGPRSTRRQVVRVGGVLAALALAVAVLLYGIHSGAQVGDQRAQATAVPSLPTPIVRYPELHGLQCLRDDAWSPDSRYFAWAGNTSQGCGYGQYFPNVINIYRAPDGAFVRQLAPDQAILAALGQAPPPTVPPYATPAPGTTFLMYDFLLWSRDGQRFAVVFVLNEGNRTLIGVAVVRTQDGGVERVALGDTLPDVVSASSYAVWDLATGSAAAYPVPITDQSAAPGFAWSTDGRLVPASPSALGTIGNPNGDARFSIWQPGSLDLSMGNGSDQPGQAGVYTFNTQLAAWSPNGRYVAAFFLAGGRVQPSHTPAPDPATLAQLHAADLPLLPLRDAGLDQALHHVVTRMDLANASSQASAWIAYRPDGKALALLDDQHDFAVYAAGTGEALYPFRYLDLLSNTHNGNAWAMRWSPDGTALLLPDGSLLHVGRLSGA